MKAYTFDMRASVTVHAETEEEARESLTAACEYQDEDAYYGYEDEVRVYLPTPDAEKATLREVYDEDGNIVDYPRPEELERIEKIKNLAPMRHREGEFDFDPVPVVSEGDDNGAYIQCWIWVDFCGTELDKEDGDEETD